MTVDPAYVLFGVSVMGTLIAGYLHSWLSGRYVTRKEYDAKMAELGSEIEQAVALARAFDVACRDRADDLHKLMTQIAADVAFVKGVLSKQED